MRFQSRFITLIVLTLCILSIAAMQTAMSKTKPKAKTTTKNKVNKTVKKPIAETAVLSKEYKPDANTVLLLHFDETNGEFKDSSGRNHNVILEKSKGSNFSTKGIIGNALSLNGEAYIEVDFKTDLEPTEMTIELWFKPSQVKDTNVLLNHGNTNSEGYYMLIQDKKINFAFSGIGGIVSATELEADKWYHIAVTYSTKSRSMSMYLNGKINTEMSVDKLENTVKVDKYVGPSMFAFRIGTYSHGLGHFFTGLIDEVRISDKVRDLSEMTTAITP
jgi:hypothetical protein